MSTSRLQSEHRSSVDKDDFEALSLRIPFDSSNCLLRSIVLAFLLGILFMLSLSSLYILARKGLRLISVRILMLATIALFASTSAFFGFVMSAVLSSNDIAVGALYGFHSSTCAIDHNRPQKLTDTSTSVALVTLAINILISDGIVYWRVFVIWGGNVFVKGLCVLLIAATLVFGAVIAYHPPTAYLRQGLLVDTGNFNSEYAGIICMIISLGGNVVATLLVSYKTWVHWNIVKNLHRTMGTCFLGSQALSTLLMVVESGAMYCIFWIFVVVGSGDIHFDPKGNVFSGFESGILLFISSWLIPIVAIYPMLIVIIVALKRSPIDRMQEQISSLVVRGNEDGVEASTALELSGVASGATHNHDIEVGATIGTSGET